MRLSLSTTLAALIATGVAACSDAPTPTTPVPATLRADRGSQSHVKTVHVMDECDPTSFNEAIGPGTCVRNGGLAFDKFIDQVTRLQRAPGWHFASDNVTLREGDVLAATNMGGEVHTFTEVEDFGGGIVPLLNTLAGTPNVAPECSALAPGDFIAPGSTKSEVEDEEGDEKYQCCIHPWMRAVVHVGKK